MRANDGSAARAEEPDDEGSPSEGHGTGGSLRFETKAAAEAAAAHIRKVAATATTEAQLNLVSVAVIVLASVLALSLLVVSWLFLLAAAVWFVVAAGIPVMAALLVAAAVNLVGVLLFLFWCTRLARNIGFSRTLKLIFPGSR